jgi:hypothetical protein
MLVLFLFFPLVLLSQDKQDNARLGKAIAESGENSIMPVTPQEAPFDLEREVKFGKLVIKNNGFAKAFQAYKAVRNENLSSCGVSGECKAVAPALLAIRYTGEGRCGDIKDASLQQLCMAINSNNCAVAPGNKKKFCQSFLDNDVNGLVAASTSLEIVSSLGFPVKKPEAALMLGIYNGFKYYSVMACEKYTNKEEMPLSRKLACKVIFSSNADREADDLTSDLALFFVTRYRSKPELCDSIVDASIKNACVDEKIKDLRDIW